MLLVREAVHMAVHVRLVSYLEVVLHVVTQLNNATHVVTHGIWGDTNMMLHGSTLVTFGSLCDLVLRRLFKICGMCGL